MDFLVQEKSGFFFCVDDRALLCRHCDLSIHSANSLSSSHKRFLIPGIQVALMAVTVQEVTEAAPQKTPQYGLPSSKMRNPSKIDPVMSVKLSDNAQPPLSSLPYHSVPESKNQGSFVPKMGEMMGASISTEAQRSPESLSKSSITEFLTDAASGWRVDELLNLADLSEGYTAANLQSSKVFCPDFWWCCFASIVCKSNQYQWLLGWMMLKHNLAFCMENPCI